VLVLLVLCLVIVGPMVVVGIEHGLEIVHLVVGIIMVEITIGLYLVLVWVLLPLVARTVEVVSQGPFTGVFFRVY
jgi:hypothetical protein